MAGKETVELVRKELPTFGRGLSYPEIHERIGMWSRDTIKKAVRMLSEEGVVVRVGTKQEPRFLAAKK